MLLLQTVFSITNIITIIVGVLTAGTIIWQIIFYLTNKVSIKEFNKHKDEMINRFNSIEEKLLTLDFDVETKATKLELSEEIGELKLQIKSLASKKDIQNLETKFSNTQEYIIKLLESKLNKRNERGD